MEELQTVFENRRQRFAAVDSLGFKILRGKTLGIVGESGSGKTIAALSVMRLLPEKARVSAGSIRFEGRELTTVPETEMRKLCGKDISMIFQDPIMSLDQVYTVGYQIVEAIRVHETVSKAEARSRALELLASVGIPHPERVYASYPFQLSGGMCQRVMIAIALSCSPKLLFADEPTTALDVTVQAQILDLLKSLQKKTRMGIALITHDLGVVAEAADHVVVMYAGKALEGGPTEVIMKHPAHPYTAGLIRAMPAIGGKDEYLYTIPGMVPDIRDMPPGCRFSTRCSLADAVCRAEEPARRKIGPDHYVRCHKA